MPSTGTLGSILSTTEVFNGFQGKCSSYILFIPHPLCLKPLAISPSPASSPFVHWEVFLSEAHGIQLLFLKTLLWLPVASGMESSPCKPGGFPRSSRLPVMHITSAGLSVSLAQFLPGNDSPEPPCLTDSGLECSVPTYSVRLSCIAPIAPETGSLYLCHLSMYHPVS